MTDEAKLKKRYLDIANRAYRENRYFNTKFLNEMEQDVLLQLEDELPIAVSLWGGNDIAERNIAVFGDANQFGYEFTMPVSLLHIVPAARKWADKLGHRDVLGAVMNLGIEREMVGDIYFKDNEAFLFCMSDLTEYIKNELSKIRHTIVRVEETPVSEALQWELAEGEEKHILVSSERLDAVVAAVYHLSRQESQSLIREKRVYVKGRCTENNSGLIKEESMISVRGKGRFFYSGVLRHTKKDRLMISVTVYGG